MRRTYAALLCFVWLLAVEVLPNVHLAAHADGHAHEHAVDGTVITVSFGDDVHSHDGVTHSHGRTAAKAKRTASRDALAIDRVPDLHAAAGLAHRALAIHAAPPPVLDAVAVDRVETELVAPATGRATIVVVTTADARGPPSTRG